MERRKLPRQVSNRNRPGVLGGDYTDEEREFLVAIDRWKRQHGPYPTWQDVLKIARSLGYRKVAEKEQ